MLRIICGTAAFGSADLGDAEFARQVHVWPSSQLAMGSGSCRPGFYDPGCHRRALGCLDFEISGHAFHETVEKEKPVESQTRTYYGLVGTGRRTAGRRGGAGTGSTGRRRPGLPRRQPTLLPSKQSATLS